MFKADQKFRGKKKKKKTIVTFTRWSNSHLEVCKPTFFFLQLFYTFTECKSYVMHPNSPVSPELHSNKHKKIPRKETSIAICSHKDPELVAEGTTTTNNSRRQSHTS